jgi:hypothetical protein
MKPIHFFPPAVALVLAGTWLGNQRQSIATLEAQSALLRKEIAARRAAADTGDADGSRPSGPGKETKDKAPIDWKKIAAQLEESRDSGGMGDMRTNMRLSQRLMSMDKDQLVAALEEIASLDLPHVSRMMLENMLIGPLIAKDPEFALTRFIDRINEDQGVIRWQLSRALGEWAKKDPTAAEAWFDRQIAAGTFESKSLDGKSQPRMQFEGALIGTLLSSNPETASLRLAGLPEDQRGEVLRNHAVNSLKQEDQLAYAKLVRQSLPEKDGQQCIAGLVSRMAQNSDDYSAVTECMDRIQATPTEREASVVKVAGSKFQRFSYQRKITRDDIEQLRNWASSQSPEQADRATGLALASTLNGGGKMEFSEIAALAVECHNASGSDELLVPILEDWQARQNKEQAIELAGKISDETVREGILKRLK